MLLNPLGMVIQNKKFGFKGNEISISLSFGVGCHTGKGIKLDKLLEMADERLCTAKNGGRNQVVST
jgi:PleD family two-component response regulator